MKMRKFTFLLAFACASAHVAGIQESRPFILPIAAKVVELSKDGKGWLESGVMKVPFVQAEASFKSAMAQSGWKYIHAVALGRGNTHTLYTWNRGSNELTLMLRRIDVGKTAFSWGLSHSRKRQNKKNQQGK